MTRNSWVPPERRLLQLAVVLFGFVPVGAGLAGVLFGMTVFDEGAVVSRELDSHGRYLSGLLLAIGLGFWSCVPGIEARGARARLLTAIVFIGGLARLYAVNRAGWPSIGMMGGLGMELVVTPAIALWRERVEWLAAAPRE